MIRRPCAWPGCRTLAPAGQSHCPAHAERAAVERWARADQVRQGDAWRRWYDTRRWRDLRLVVLTEAHWTCQWSGCGVMLREGRSRADAAVVDHIRPHRGDPAWFWARANLQALCKACHDGRKRVAEARIDAEAAALGCGSGPKREQDANK